MSYKILSLDGGDSGALLQARRVQIIYSDIQSQVLLGRFYQLIVKQFSAFSLRAYLVAKKNENFFVRLKANE